MEVNNEYFMNLFGETWVEVGEGATTQYQAVGRDGINALGTDLQVKFTFQMMSVVFQMMDFK